MVAIYALFGRLLGKKVLFWVKKVFLGQEVHYYMVYIAYYTDLILQICIYAQKQHICREDSNFCHPAQNRLLSALRDGENVLLCKTPEKRSLY